MHLGNGVVCPISAIVMFGVQVWTLILLLEGQKKNFVRIKSFMQLH